jgi:hypothetical protein
LDVPELPPAGVPPGAPVAELGAANEIVPAPKASAAAVTIKWDFRMMAYLKRLKYSTPATKRHASRCGTR